MTEITDTPELVDDTPSEQTDATISALEAEGDIAADYIEELLDIADLDGDIDIEVRAGRAYVSVTSDGADDLATLSRPDTVNALQELTRLAVQTRTGEYSPRHPRRRRFATGARV